MLSNTDLIGLIVLIGPLFTVLISLLYMGVKSGLRDHRRNPIESDTKDKLRKYSKYTNDLHRVIEEIQSNQSADKKDTLVYLVKWLNRIVILPFSLISYEAIRVLDILLDNDLPFIPHAVTIMILSLLNLAVSTYYGFFIKYK